MGRRARIDDILSLVGRWEAEVLVGLEGHDGVVYDRTRASKGWQAVYKSRACLIKRLCNGNRFHIIEFIPSQLKSKLSSSLHSQSFKPFYILFLHHFLALHRQVRHSKGQFLKGQSRLSSLLLKNLEKSSLPCEAVD